MSSRPGGGRGRAAAGRAALVVLVLTAAGCSGSRSDAGTTGSSTTARGSRSTTTAQAAATTSTVPAASADLLAAACAGTAEARPGARITDADLDEVSGVVATDGRTWVHNDSGDTARIFGIDADGSVQAVTVDGAEAVDWEDLTIERGADPHLWIADVGDNLKKRPTTRLYRVPVPEEGATEVTAEAVDVTDPGGPVDIEAVLADTDGSIYLLTKWEHPSRILRVRPPEGGGAAEAVEVGTFAAGVDGTGIVTGASLAPDRRAIAVRTYDGAWLYPVGPDQPLAEALADTGSRCRAPAGTEAQGEAISFTADGSGFVTIGEGSGPILTTVSAG